jgi:UDP-N-acetylmuramyl pentapeptide synthase
MTGRWAIVIGSSRPSPSGEAEGGVPWPSIRVRYRLRDIPALLATPVGRSRFWDGVRYRAWPLYSGATALYRRTRIRDTRLVAVVGSFGKSTTTRATSAALDAELIWFANHWASVARAVLSTRPGAVHKVIEVGIDGPDQMRRYARTIRPDVTIVTSIGTEHHRSLRTLENTRNEKADMVRALPERGLAVLNGDDPNVLWMRGETGARVVTYGRGEHNDVVFSDVKLDWPRGTRYRIRAGGVSGELRVRLLGWPMIYAVTAAAATALAEGVPFDSVAERLATLAPTVGRLQVVDLPDGVTLLRDDYKSALETVEAALDLLESVPAKRKLVVIGEVSEPPGAQGPIYRHLGERIAGMASKLVVLGGSFQRYASGATQAGMAKEAIVDAGRSVIAALEAIREDLRPGDVVLVKGRDTQRLDRVALGLMGKHVGCTIEACDVKPGCESCPMLERGWGNRRVVT